MVVRAMSENSNVLGLLSTGDILLSVDALPVQGVEHARELLRGPVGTEVVVEVQRGRSRHRFLIERETTNE